MHRLRAMYREQWRYRRERAFMDHRLSIRSERRSILLFTTHKCASTYVVKCLADLNKRRMGMTLLDLEGLIWNKYDHDVHGYLSANSSELFRPKGIIYAPLRRLIDVPHLERYRLILFLRDPRDVLVSHYYSMAFSHGLPGNPNRRSRFLDIRKNTKSMDIDDYVLGACDTFLPIFEDYRALLSRSPETTLLFYETFATDFQRWVDQLCNALEIDVSDSDRERLWKLKGGDLPAAENVHAHVRSGAPGGHRDKLSENTLAVLNQRFRSVLESMHFGAPDRPMDDPPR